MKTKDRKKTETIAERVQSAIRESEEPQVAAEIERLNAELHQVELQISELLAEGTDVERMAAALIEKGEKPDAKANGERVRLMRQQAEAYRLAISRAERKRGQILASVSEQHAETFQAEHNRRLKGLVTSLDEFCSGILSLSFVPNVLRSNGLQADALHFPTPCADELVQLRHRLQHVRRSISEFVSGD